MLGNWGHSARIPTPYTPWSPRHQHLISVAGLRWKRYELDPIVVASHRVESGAVWEDRRSATENYHQFIIISHGSVLCLGGVVGCTCGIGAAARNWNYVEREPAMAAEIDV